MRWVTKGCALNHGTHDLRWVDCANEGIYDRHRRPERQAHTSDAAKREYYRRQGRLEEIRRELSELS